LFLGFFFWAPPPPPPSQIIFTFFLFFSVELQVLHKQSDRSESFTVPTHAHTGGACI
jgi:hypothetical protein